MSIYWKAPEKITVITKLIGSNVEASLGRIFLALFEVG